MTDIDNELASIKKPGDFEKISDAEFQRRILEIAKCKRDITYFAEKYFKIINLDKGLMTIKLYNKQKELLDFFVNEKRCVVCASRQSSKCVSFWTLICIRHKRFKWLKFKIPIGILCALYTLCTASQVKKATQKFVNIIDIKSWEVFSDNGYVDIKTINKTVPFIAYELTTETGKKLRCADDHVLIEYDSYHEMYAKDALNRYVNTINGPEKIINIEKTNQYESMYDLELSEQSNHLYYTNGILSHNTTTYTIYLLWLTNFFPEKKVMLLANKLETALEILGRIRLAYEYLPHFLKASVLVWNKGEIVFGNMSTIKGFSTSSSAARGFSANCCHKSTKITIRLFKFLKINIPIKWLTWICK